MLFYMHKIVWIYTWLIIVELLQQKLLIATF